MSTFHVLKIQRSFLVIKRYYAAKEPKKESKPAAPEKPIDPKRVFKIYRFPGVKNYEEPKLQSYDLDVSTCGTMILDALIKIKDSDPTLTFRRSCREGICGSCAMNLQGRNCLACITKIPNDKVITIHPLPHMYVIRDLVVDMTHFFNGYDSIRPYLVRKREIASGGQYAQSIPDSLKMVGLYECVLCACCATSCPSYWWNGRRFLGPASLLHAYRWCIDSRDEDTDNRLHELRDDFKAFRCHTILNCTVSCPKKLHPGQAIARLKRMISKLDKKPASELDAMKFGSSGLKACTKKC